MLVIVMFDECFDEQDVHPIVALFVLLFAEFEEVVALLPELLDLEWYVPQLPALMRVCVFVAAGAQAIAVLRIEARVLMPPAPKVRVVVALPVA